MACSQRGIVAVAEALLKELIIMATTGVTSKFAHARKIIAKIIVAAESLERVIP